MKDTKERALKAVKHTNFRAHFKDNEPLPAGIPVSCEVPSWFLIDAMSLLKPIADEYTGRDSLALLDHNIGQTAEEILAKMENREPQEPED